MVRVSTRRGTIELAVRADGGIPPNDLHSVLLRRGRRQHPTNPQLDPFGKIPEFKYCAARYREGCGGGARGRE